MAISSSEREMAVFMAMLAEQAQRYDDMMTEMGKLARKVVELSEKERKLLSVGFKKALERRRDSCRRLKSLKYDDVARTNGTKIYLEKVLGEYNRICHDILDILVCNLIPRCNTFQDPIAGVFYRKMAGDYYRYLAEIIDDASSDECKAAIDKSSKVYEIAEGVAMKYLPSAHPIRLGLALNYSIFQYEMRSAVESACAMAKKALVDACTGLGRLKSEEEFKDSAKLMQFLKDNIIIWNAEMAGHKSCVDANL